MNTCQSCGCNPCACPGPSVLANARLIDPVMSGGTWTGGTIDGATINGGTSNGQQINQATIDCLTIVCTQPPGTCDATIASTGFVCTAINDAINATNPDFCLAVQLCIAAAPALCTEIINCINTNPGSINNPIAFDPAVFATSVQVGVIRIATLGEVQGASCGLAIDPCTLEAFFNAGGPNTLWNAFAAAVDGLLLSSAGLCAAVFACGAAPLTGPVFTGDPQAPTPPLADNDTSIATTAFVNSFVNAALGNSISALNPAFCAAVAACVGGGGPGNFASFTVPVSSGGGAGIAAGPAVANYGCVVLGVGPSYSVTFNVPQPDLNYIANSSLRATSGAFPQIFTGQNAVTGLGLHGGLEAASIASTVTVGGVGDLIVQGPQIAGGLPYNGFVTVVFSR